VNKNNLMKGLPLALLLASPMVSAQSDYPAPFEPKVIYQDADLIDKYGSKQSPAAPAPAAAPVVSSAAASSAPEATSVEAASAPVATFTQEESALSQNFPILIIGVGLIGALVWSSKRSGGASATPSFGAASGAGAAAIESVASCYKDGPLVVGVGETGVSDYLKKLPSAEAVVRTGVAKYMLSLPAPVPVEPVETGVTKYVKKLPKPPVLPTDESGVAKYVKTL
jgi:hypothetical protein